MICVRRASRCRHYASRLGGADAALTLPECHEDENQRDDGQTQIPELEARFCQQIVCFGFAWQPDAEDCTEEQHENRPNWFWFLTINAWQDKSVIGFTSRRARRRSRLPLYEFWDFFGVSWAAQHKKGP